MRLKKDNQEVSGIMLIYVNILIGFVMSVVYTPYMLRILSKTEYGLYIQIGSLVGFLSLADFGLHSTITRYVAKFQARRDDSSLKEQNRFLGSCQTIYLFFTVLALAIGVILLFNLPFFLKDDLSIELVNKARIMAVFIVAQIVFAIPLGIYQGVLEGYGQYYIVNTVKIIKNILLYLTYAAVLFFGAGLIGLVAVNLFYSLAVPVYFAIQIRQNMGICIHTCRVQKKAINEITQFSVYVFIIAIVNQFYWKTGQIILGKELGPDSAAVYGLGTQIIGYITPITLAISQVFLPKITKIVVRDKNMERINRLFCKVSRAQFALLTLIIIGFAAVGEDFIVLWVGDAYRESFGIVMVLMVGVIAQSVLTIGTSVLKALNKHKYHAYIYLSTAVASIITSYFVSKIYGTVGVAYVTMIAMIVQNILISIIYKKVGIDIVSIFWNMLKFTFIPICGTVAATLILQLFAFNGIAKIAMFVCTLSIIYLLLIWTFSLSKAERTSFIAHIKGKRHLATPVK